MPLDNKLDKVSGANAIPVKCRGLPKWLLYSGLGLTVLAAAAYVGVGLATAAPESRTQPQVNPPAVTTPVRQPTPVVTAIMPGLENILTEQQMIEYANSVKENQPITEEVLNKINAINKTLYFRFTGNTVENAKFISKFLTANEYEALEGKPGGTLPGSIGTIGIFDNGETFLYVNKDFSTVRQDGPLEVLRILARETGQAEALRRFANPQARQAGVGAHSSYYDAAAKYGLTDLTGTFDRPKLDLLAIFIESLQTLYQAAVFHYLEESGVIVYPALSDSSKEIDATIESMLKNDHFVVQASFVDWYRALNRADTRESLQKAGKITSEEAMNLFNTYIQRTQTREGLEQAVVEVVTAVRTAPEYAQQIRDAVHRSQRGAKGLFYP